SPADRPAKYGPFLINVDTFPNNVPRQFPLLPSISKFLLESHRNTILWTINTSLESMDQLLAVFFLCSSFAVLFLPREVDKEKRHKGSNSLHVCDPPH